MGLYDNYGKGPYILSYQRIFSSHILILSYPQTIVMSPQILEAGALGGQGRDLRMMTLRYLHIKPSHLLTCMPRIASQSLCPSTTLSLSLMPCDLHVISTV